MIYLFNNREELVHILAEEDLVEFTHTVKINAFDEAEFEVALSVDRSVFEGVAYFGFFTREQVFGMFKLYSFEINQGYLIKGLDRAESDLRTVGIIKDKRPKNVTADQALTVAFEGTGYHLGEVRGLTHVNSLSFYYISPREALVKIIEAFNCEFRVRYTFVENKVIGRYIDLYKKQGVYTGVQFEYGDNALEVVYEENSDDVVTALIGRGKGEETESESGEATGGYGRRIEFTDVVWSKSAGKPVDKPAGQNYVVLSDDFERKALFQDGRFKHRWGVYVNEDITDKELLLQRTFEELERLNSPLRIYKAKILDIGSDVWLGDRIGIVRDEVGVAFEARIFKIVIDKLNFDQSSVELGDYETLKNHQNSSSQAVRDAINSALDEQAQAMEAFNIRLQEELKRKNQEFDEQVRVFKLEMDNGIEQAKAKAEEEAQKVRDEIDQEIDKLGREMSTSISARVQADIEALKSDSSSLLGEFPDQLKALKEELGTERRARVDMSETLDGIQTSIDAVGLYFDKKGRPSEKLSQYVRSETAESLSAMRVELGKGFVKQSSFTDAVNGINRRFESVLAPVDGKIASKIAEYKQGVDGQFATITRAIDDTIKQSDVSITDSGIRFGSKKAFGSQELASMLAISPESVNVITNKMILADTTNLISAHVRKAGTLTARDFWLTQQFPPPITAGDEFVFKCKASWAGTLNHGFDFLLHIKYKNGRDDWLSGRMARAGDRADVTKEYTASVKAKVTGEVEHYNFLVIQDGWSNFTTIFLSDLRLYKKAGAELIVDGAITAKHIRTGAIETPHIKTEAIEAKHLKVDNALLDKLVANDAIVAKLFARQAMINHIQSVQIQASQVSANLLRGYVGEIGGFRIGKNPNDGGLWLTGTNNFRIGLAQGANDYNDNAAAIWAGWSDNWNNPGPRAWWVTRGGTMHAKKEIRLYNGAKIAGGNLTYSNGTYVYSKNVKSMEFSYQESSEGNDWMYFSVGNAGPYDDAHLKYYVRLTYSTSDRRFKHAIRPTAVNGLEAIRSLTCYEYDQTTEHGHERHIDCGIMAQDVKKYMKDAHSVLPSGRERYEPFEFIPYLVKAIQELDAKNQELEKRLAEKNG